MKENNFIVYVHKNKVNSKLYIGITGQSFDQRCKNGEGNRKCTYFYNAIQKYGWVNFEHIILIDGLSKEMACICETYLINKYKTLDQNYGYNLTSGGEHPVLSDITRKKIKDNHANFKGKNHPLYGKHLSEKTKEKLRNKLIGKKQSIEQRNKHSNDMKGKNNPRAKKVKCINNGMIFDTARDAAKWSNQYDGSYIGKCCKGLTPYAGRDPQTGKKLKWEYV